MSDTSIEEWKDVPGFVGYQVSNFGSLRSRRPKNGKGALKKEWHILNPSTNKRGYKYFVFSRGKNKKSKTMRIHAVVLMSFVGKRPKGYLGCHRDDNKVNNCLSNLRWDTHAGNENDKVINGTMRAENNGRSILTERDVREIKKIPRRRGLAYRVAKEYGVTYSAIKNIFNGRSWSHVL